MFISKSPTTARNDVSQSELKLRQLDNRDKMMRAFEVVVLLTLVVIQVFILIRVLENSNYNRLNLNDHSKSVEEHRIDNERVHANIETLICNVILPRPTVTAEEKRVCAEIQKKNSSL